MVKRLRFRWMAFKHRLLLRASVSYRNHDQIVAERNQLRTERGKLDGDNVLLRVKIRELEGSIAESKRALSLANEAQDKTVQQLVAERALRTAAEERAERYHDQMIEALMEDKNWLAYGISRKRIHSGVGGPEETPREETAPQPMPGKRHAREVARESEGLVIKDMLARMQDQLRDEVPVGPEFSTQ